MLAGIAQWGIISLKAQDLQNWEKHKVSYFFQKMVWPIGLAFSSVRWLEYPP